MIRVVRILLVAASIGGLLALGTLLAITQVIPAQTGKVSLTVQTPSMLPAIAPGDIVIVDPAEAGNVGRGDIVTFHPDSGSSTTITHRIIESSIVSGGQQYVTQGDYNPVPDAPIKAAQIAGKVTQVIPKAGLVLDQRTYLLAAIAASVGLGLLALVLPSLAPAHIRGSTHHRTREGATRWASS